MTTKISIIIPCYNVEKYVEQCLESVINQSYSNLEIICIDDGSTDETLKILENTALIESRLIVYNQKNNGVSSARTNGLNKSSGDFIMFLDGDDWLDNNTISCLLEQYSDEDIIFFSYVREFKFSSSAKRLPLKGVYEAEYIQRRLIGPINEEKLDIASIDSFSTIHCKLYKKSIFSNKTAFRNLAEIGTWEDGFFNVEVLENCTKVLIVDNCFYHYRKYNSTSITSISKTNLQEKWINKFKLMQTFLVEKNKSSKYFVALNNRVCITFLGLCLNEINNRETFFNTNKKIKLLIASEFYRNAFKKFTLAHLPFHWKVFYFFIKIKFSLGVTFLSFSIHRIINRKN